MATISQIISEFGQPPLCLCGCGIRYKIIAYKYSTYKKNGGYPKFHKGHQNKGKIHSEKQNKEFALIMSKTMSGIGHWNYNHDIPRTIEEIIKVLGEIPLCQCGCNQKVNINPKKYRKYQKQGYPKFLPKHHCKLENNPAWIGGVSFGDYCPKFNNIKKEEIRNKYQRKCLLCGKLESECYTKSNKHYKLHIHHIDYNKLQGCEGHVWKLVPLCMNCHSKTSHSKSRKIYEDKICEILTKIDNTKIKVE